MAWYRFGLSHTTDGLMRALGQLPGVTVRGRQIDVHENAAWMVERACRQAGVSFGVDALREDGEPLEGLERLVAHGLREWVPGYLTEYQKEGVLSMAHRDGHFWWAAGSGKTLGAICWALADPGATVLVTRAGVRRQHGREIERVTTHRALVVESVEDVVGIDDSDALFAVVGYEMLPDLLPYLVGWRPKNLVLDECFPAGTLVDTADGAVPIERLLPGDLVRSVGAQGEECFRSVSRLIAKRLSSPLVRVQHASGDLTCTSNHKVWTLEDGYVEAGRLTDRHHLRVVQNNQGSADKSFISSAFLQPIMLVEMEREFAGNKGADESIREKHCREDRRIEGDVATSRISREGGRADADSQPDEHAWREGKGKSCTHGQTLTQHPWWEWERPDSPANHDLSVVSIAGRRVLRWSSARGPNGHRDQTVLCRPSRSIEEAGDRGRWAIAQHEPGEGAGCTQGRNPVFSRVVGVESEEQRGDGRSGEDEGANQYVFDLEVDDTHCYFARGVLVSNCHKVRSAKRWQATVMADGKVRFDPKENIAQAVYQLSRKVRRRLGTTATPIKDRVRDLWAQLDLIHPDAWGKFSSRAGASFAERYCDAHESRWGGYDTSGSSNTDELWQRVSFVTHHVPHSVTHRDLPPKRRVVTYVTPAEQCRAEGFNKAFFASAGKGGKTALLEARLMEAASKKRKVLLELVEEAVLSGQKVTVFTGRRQDCERLAEELEELLKDVTVYMGHGGTSVKERDAMVLSYMSSSGPCVFVGTGDAFGEGVSLHDTDLALIAMLPYTPGAIVQWEGRFSRHGQKRPVLVQYLVAEGTVDEHVVEILLGKLAPVEDVAGDDSLTGFQESLRGAGSEDEILAGLLSRIG